MMGRGLSEALQGRWAPPPPAAPEGESYEDLFADLDILGNLEGEAREHVVRMLLGFMGLHDALMGFAGPERLAEAHRSRTVDEAIGCLRSGEGAAERRVRLRWHLLQMEKGFLAMRAVRIGDVDGIEFAIRRMDHTWHALARWVPGEDGGRMELARTTGT